MTVPLPSDTVTPQMKDLAASVKTELISHLQNYTFALQIYRYVWNCRFFGMKWLRGADPDGRIFFYVNAWW